MDRGDKGAKFLAGKLLANRCPQPAGIILCQVLVILALLVSGHSYAGSFEDGEAAFRRRHYEAAMQHWRPLAEQGDARAQAGVAAMYLSGHGVVQDEAEALLWATRAADQEEFQAQYLLGSMYRDGKGVEKDFVRAIEWFGKAAHRGYHWAQYSLGLMHFVGEGVPLDYAEAYYWLLLASAVREHEDAQLLATASFLLEQAAAQLTREQREQAKGRAAISQRSSR